MEDYSILRQVVAWLPLIALLLFFVAYMRRAFGRQTSMLEVGRENTEAVKENTRALKELLAAFEKQAKP